MASLNKVTLIGNLGKDPEIRYTPNGAAVCNVSVATTRNWKNKDSGERQEETEWHRVVFYDRLAEIAGEYLRKGRPVYVEGRLKTRKWQDKDGRDVYTTEIVADQMQLLGNRDGSQGSDQSDQGQDSGYSTPAPSQQQSRSAPARQQTAQAAPARQQPAAQRPAPAPANRGTAPNRSAPQRSVPAQTSTGFDDMDEDIPF